MPKTGDVYVAVDENDEEWNHTVIPMVDDTSPLVYCCVARSGSGILAEYNNGVGGNAESCIWSLLQTSKFENLERYVDRAEKSANFVMERFSMSYDSDHIVHVIVCDPWLNIDDFSKGLTTKVNPLIFLLVSTKSTSIVTAFGFLYDVVSRVYYEYEEHSEVPARAIHGSLQKDLGGPLQTMLDYWSSDEAKLVPEVAKMKGQVDGVKDVMLSNLDEMIKRHDQIQELVEKTEKLEYESQAYQTTAKDLHRYQWWEANKIYIYIGCLIASVLFLMYLIN